MLRIGALVTFALAMSQIVNSLPGRFGTIGETLSALEIAQITGLANAAGKDPWLVFGDRSMEGVAYLTVYLQPDVTRGLVRRGRLLRLVADQPPVVPTRSTWRLRDIRSYAYVALPDRPPGEISSAMDRGWPFSIEGEFDDETLTSLVAFIRSAPEIPGVPAKMAPRAVARAPISAVARRDGEFIVQLRRGELIGADVRLTRSDGRWFITNYGEWIV